MLAAAEQAAAGPRLPDLDATDLALVTVDPPGSRDLDQALHLAARPGGGFQVSYAIADVAAFVPPGGPVDVEAHRRGETFYSPDARTPLHPPVLGEGAASLLPDGPRPALLWRIDVDADGDPVTVDVRRAMVRSRARLDYPGLQQAIDAGAAPDPVRLLPDFGTAALARAAARGSVELALPEQEVVARLGGGWTLAFRAPLPVEDWNAQVSLLTGRCAARLMLDGGVGLLRTLPPPEERTVAALRRAAPALGVGWPAGARPGDVLRGLDRSRPAHAAFLDLAAALLRGAGYTAFDGAPPEQAEHAGVAAPYAHVTAPLRRLADRYAGEVCVALCAGAQVPSWARSALPQLPETMTASGRTAHGLERAAVDATEAWLLRDRVGETFPAVVVEADGDRGTVVLDDPAVRARCDGAGLPLGERVTARLAEADVARRTVRFTL